MIKLTVNPRTNPQTHIFDKATVDIGSSINSTVDLSLPNEKLEPIHVKIIEHGNYFIAINQANDPFVSINGIPFGRKAIYANDILEIRSTEILFEGLVVSPIADLGILDTASDLHPIVDNVIQKKEQQIPREFESTHHNPFYEARAKISIVKQEEEEDFDLEKEMRLLDEWLQETSHLSSEVEEEIEEDSIPEEMFEVDPVINKEPPPLPPIEPSIEEEADEEEKSPAPPVKSLRKQTIKDLYFKEQEEETSEKNRHSDTLAGSPSSPLNWHTVWIIFVGILSTIIVIALLLYAKASGKSEDEEIRAAEGVSDVAMALTYAQFNDIIPQNQNWSDPEFIKNNLTAILATEYPSLAKFDSHGQFNHCPYLLRIYTSSDLSNFLVIAQPAPSLQQWLIPKSVILVYSSDMQLRKTKDLKSLNRLLVDPSLDGSVANEVASIVKKAEIIPLSALANKHSRLGFSPPTALALMRPGAENYIYNAPRYYGFSESIIKDAVILADNQENNNEILHFKHHIKALNRYSNFVMYSSQGMLAASQAQKALSLFEPQANYLIAYLQFNPHGLVQNSHLLMEDKGNSEIAINESSSEKNTSPLSPIKNPPAYSLEDKEGSVDSTEVTTNDIANPLFFQLSALASHRQQVLKLISKDITSLLEQEDQSAVVDFKEKFNTLTQKYILATEEETTRLAKGIKKLYGEYSSLPLVDFLHFLKSAGLSSFAQEILKKQEEELALASNVIKEEDIDHQLKHLRESSDFVELESEIINANKLFTLDNIPDPEKVISLQNTLRSETQNKLNEFLLSSKTPLTEVDFSKESRVLLEKILKASWIRQQEEVEYYLSEFDQFSKSHRQPVQFVLKPENFVGSEEPPHLNVD